MFTILHLASSAEPKGLFTAHPLPSPTPLASTSFIWHYCEQSTFITSVPVAYAEVVHCKIRICETACRIIVKAILSVAKGDVRNAAGARQLCAGQIAGIEPAIHCFGCISF